MPLLINLHASSSRTKPQPMNKQKNTFSLFSLLWHTTHSSHTLSNSWFAKRKKKTLRWPNHENDILNIHLFSAWHFSNFLCRVLKTSIYFTHVLQLRVRRNIYIDFWWIIGSDLSILMLLKWRFCATRSIALFCLIWRSWNDQS